MDKSLMWKNFEQESPKQEEENKSTLCVVICKDRRKPLLAEYFFLNGCFVDLYSEDELKEVVKFLEIPKNEMLYVSPKERDLKKNKHHQAYLSRLQDNTEWNGMTEEELKKCLFKIVVPEITMEELRDISPDAFVAFVNVFIRKLQEIHNGSEYKKVFESINRKELLKDAYFYLGSIVDECEYDYCKRYYKKPKYAIEYLSEYPKARFSLIQFFAMKEQEYLYTQAEIEEIKKKLEEEKQKKKEEKIKKEKMNKEREERIKAWIQSAKEKYDLDFVLYQVWDQTNAKLIINKKDAQFVQKRTEITRMCNDIIEKFGVKGMTNAVGFVVENINEFNAFHKQMKVFTNYQTSISRPDIIAASNYFFEQYKKEYERIIDTL